jgi:hypothetical protein
MVRFEITSSGFGSRGPIDSWGIDSWVFRPMTSRRPAAAEASSESTAFSRW